MKNPDDDVNFEPDEDLGDVAAAQAKLKKLKDEFAEVKAQRQEYLDGWQRCKADSVNARKDALQAAEREAGRSRDILIHDIIPALDSFEMATASEAWGAIDKGWRTGMENVQNLLFDALAKSGVSRYGRIGESFDPMLHEMVDEEHEGAAASQTITRVVRSGYRIGERVLRAAQVIVKK
ncbi:MAG: nucleotide exchange factor GrpE [bacterium]|nr:nucleotide exchange factor GrpE [bacterium]